MLMFLLVDFASPRPAYLQLRDQVVVGIATGALHPGDPLPSVRRLASELNLNVHTINKAFAVLRQEGFIRLTERQGATVDPQLDATESTQTRLAAALTPLLAEFVVKGLGHEEIGQQVSRVLASMHAPTAAEPPSSYRRRAGER